MKSITDKKYTGKNRMTEINLTGTEQEHSCCAGPGYASPQEAMQAEPEKLLYAVALYTGTGNEAPDNLATVDVDPQSTTYSQVIARTPAPNLGDELHHFAWNACSSCHGDEPKPSRIPVLPRRRP